MKQNNHLVQNLSIYDVGIIGNHALDNSVIHILITRGVKDFYFYQTVFLNKITLICEHPKQKTCESKTLIKGI